MQEKKIKEREKKNSLVFATYKLNIGSHKKQHEGCEARQVNPASGQRRASPDDGRMNPTG